MKKYYISMFALILANVPFVKFFDINLLTIEIMVGLTLAIYLHESDKQYNQ